MDTVTAVNTEERSGRSRSHSHGRTERNAFIPLLILALTVVGWSIFQMTHLLRERDSFATMRSNQERPMENGKKLRDQLDGIARETQLLANRGNSSARLIVDELRKRGITINPDSQPPANKK